MFASTCDHQPCEWVETSNHQSEVKVLTTLHVIDKHPEEYRRLTGKDPDTAKLEYKDYFRAYKGRY